MGTPPPVGGLPPRWTGPPLRSVALSAAGGVTTDPPLGRCPCREPPQTLSLLLANRHGRFEIADFHYENQSRSQAPRRLFAEARASPTAHTHVEHLRSRRPGPACRRFVQALAALKRLVNGYSVSPAKLIMDDDDGSVDMDELVFRPNPVERLEISNSDDDE